MNERQQICEENVSFLKEISISITLTENRNDCLVENLILTILNENDSAYTCTSLSQSES